MASSSGQEGGDPSSRLGPVSSWKPFQSIPRGKAIDQHELLSRRSNAKTDAEKTAEFDAARKSLYGELANDPIAGCQACLVQRKAATRQQRKDLVDRAIASGCANCKERAQRLRSDMDEIENMRCAKHIYLAEDPTTMNSFKEPPVGFKNPTDQELAELGLTKEMLQPEGSNFRAKVYMRDPEIWSPPNPPDPKAIVAFRGSTPHLEDWENNFMQGANEDPRYLGADGVTANRAYYGRAVEIGKTVGASSKSVRFVGHSLGGGLASAAQAGSGGPNGNPASTYNSAGLHSGTAKKYGSVASADPAKINAIRVKGEVLTESQESGLSGMVAPSAVGTKRDLKPVTTKDAYKKGQGQFDSKAAAATGDDYDADDAYSTSLHGMDEVIASMEAQKQADQAELQECAAKQHSLVRRTINAVKNWFD